MFKLLTEKKRNRGHNTKKSFCRSCLTYTAPFLIGLFLVRRGHNDTGKSDEFPWTQLEIFSSAV